MDILGDSFQALEELNVDGLHVDWLLSKRQEKSASDPKKASEGFRARYAPEFEACPRPPLSTPRSV